MSDTRVSARPYTLWSTGTRFGVPAAQTTPGPTPVLLLHFNGVNGGTVFTDSSPSNHTISQDAGNVSNAVTKTDQSVFGGSSLYLDGTCDLQTPSSSDFFFNTGDFTIDMWIRRDGAQAQNNFAGWGGQVIPMFFSPASQHLRSFFFAFMDADDEPNTIADDTWYHIAFCRVSGTSRMFLNGILQSTFADTNVYDATNLSGPLFIGANQNHVVALKGWIDELRIVNGVGVWTSNFTPPTLPYAP